MKIVLVGFMGSGKSTAAKLLSDRLSLERVEMDDLIVAASRRDSIPEIFEKDGEPCFRELENSIALELADVSNVIISTGGGVIESQSAMSALAKGAVVVYLQAGFETVQRRVGHEADRPLLKDLSAARDRYTSRLEQYRSSAHVTVATDRLTPEEVVTAIEKAIEGGSP